MTIETILLIVLVVITSGFLIVGVLMSRLIRDLKKELTQVNSRIQGLEASLVEQERLVRELQSKQASRKTDPIFVALESLMDLRKDGMVRTLSKVGIGLFQAYWKPKRRNAAALPEKTVKDQ